MIAQNGPSFTLNLGDRTLEIISARFLGSGDFNVAYFVETDEGQKVLKIPNERSRGLSDKTLAKRLMVELLVYKQFKRALEGKEAGRLAICEEFERHLGAPDETITTDWIKENLPANGFQLIEYIPHEYPISPTQTNVAQNPIEQQLRQMIQVALDTDMRTTEGFSIAPDIKHDNVRMDDAGTLVLIDYAFPEDDEIFRCALPRILESFAPPGSERSNWLQPTLDGHNPDSRSLSLVSST
jgi:hypothetical protein